MGEKLKQYLKENKSKIRLGITLASGMYMAYGIGKLEMRCAYDEMLLQAFANGDIK